jgi:hypothetical protein
MKNLTFLTLLMVFLLFTSLQAQWQILNEWEVEDDSTRVKFREQHDNAHG